MHANIALFLMIRALELAKNLWELCSDDDAGVFPRPWAAGKHQAVFGRMILHEQGIVSVAAGKNVARNTALEFQGLTFQDRGVFLLSE